MHITVKTRNKSTAIAAKKACGKIKCFVVANVSSGFMRIVSTAGKDS
jgi:hypothetical protein